MEKINIKTKKEREMVDITQEVQELITKANKKDGFCHLFLKHTTAGLTTADLNPESELEIFDAFEIPIPKKESPRLKYEHTHTAVHMPSHFMASFLGPSLVVPVEDGKLVLGDYQKIVLVELNGPEKREIIFGC
ncbi:MAG TPA: secondary thiamine-phosphate synthase enzyme YjbQ [Candidatus Nanoarchaeia archaeon]|nr:hypothetical protein [uncultured archaeon]